MQLEARADWGPCFLPCREQMVAPITAIFFSFYFCYQVRHLNCWFEKKQCNTKEKKNGFLLREKGIHSPMKSAMKKNGKRWTKQEDAKLEQAKHDCVEQLRRDCPIQSPLSAEAIQVMVNAYVATGEKSGDISYTVIDKTIRDIASGIGRSAGAIKIRWNRSGATVAHTAEDPEEYRQLGESQNCVADLVLKQRKNVFFTGAAGSGKTFLLQYLVRQMRSQNRKVAVCAPTGLAACHVGGITLHKFCGWGPDEEKKEVDDLVQRARTRRIFAQRWNQIQVLVIDEISMVSAMFFEKLDAMVRILRKKPAVAFGGIQVVLCGDFFQLPPVLPAGPKQFCFEADNWEACIHQQVELTQVYRQTDQGFLTVLAEVRTGRCSEESQRLLQSRMIEAKTSGTEDIIPTSLFSHRKNVAEENETQLAALTTPPVVFCAIDTGTPAYKPKLNTDCNALQKLTLKIGAQVILIKNLETMKSGLANGSRGVVIGFCQDMKTINKRLLPQVKFTNGLVKTMNYEKFRVLIGETEVSCRQQIPLDLAWATTVHRSQGMTLDCVKLDLDKCFETGQVYVALSRCRTLAGMFIQSFDPKKIKVHPKVVAFAASARFLPPPPPNQKRKVFVEEQKGELNL